MAASNSQTITSLAFRKTYERPWLFTIKLVTSEARRRQTILACSSCGISTLMRVISTILSTRMPTVRRTWRLRAGTFRNQPIGASPQRFIISAPYMNEVRVFHNQSRRHGTYSMKVAPVAISSANSSMHYTWSTKPPSFGIGLTMSIDWQSGGWRMLFLNQQRRTKQLKHTTSSDCSMNMDSESTKSPRKLSNCLNEQPC